MISRQTNYLKGAITKMKRLFASVISCVLILSMICSGLTVFATTITGAVDTDNFVRGVDVSTLDMLEDLGARYYQNNVESDALTILKNNGANYVRLKLWVDPYDENGNPYGGGNNDYATTLALARRAKNLGMGVLIDFHLSDFWTDPANQIKPKAWKDLSYSELKTTLYNYMKDTLNNFAAAGIVPEMVQVGNEISTGILHDDGKVGNGNEDFSNLAGLLESAIAGVRASSASNTKIILHLDMGGQNSLYTWFFGGLLTASPNLDFDVFGLSYYPMWHGTMEGLQYNINYLASTYGKEVYDGDYKLTFWDDSAYSCSVYKTFTNLPNGTYQFSIWAKTNGDQDVLQLYAKNYGGDELTTTITTSDINWNIFTIDEIVVTNNTLEIGVYTVAGADDWCNLDMAILRKVE